MRVIELFAGVGGFRLGLERAGHQVVWANEWDKYACDTYDKNFSNRGLGGDTVSPLCLERPRPQEGDDSGTRLLQTRGDDGHFRDCSCTKDNNRTTTNADLIDRRDLTTIPATDIPEHDIICGGFPCQAFSIAGKRRGFDETRGTLVFEILRIAKHHRTPYLLLENVKGLLNHDGGQTFEVILRALDDLGYDAQWQVLNSKNFGVPQNRERVIIIANLRGFPRPQVFPLGRTDIEDTRTGQLIPYGTSQDQKLNPLDGVSQTLSAGHFNVPKIVVGTINRGEFKETGGLALTIPASYYKGHDNHGARPMIHQLNAPKHSNDRVYGVDGISPTLNTMQGGRRQPFVAMTETRTEEAKAIRRETKDRDFSPRRGKVLVPRLDDIGNTVTATQGKEQLLISKTIRVGGGKSPHGSKQNWDSYEIDGRIRRLTPVECERLQGFPDNWTEGVSDTQRYKQMGNAVTVNVIEAVARLL